MEPYKLYMMQTSYDGLDYTLGDAVDTHARWNIVCAESPFKRYGEPQNIASRDWIDEHGSDVYIPADVKFKSFDADFTFLCAGIESDVKSNFLDFHKFLTGKNDGATGARLVIYDTYNSLGWKDVYLKSISPDAFVMDNGDNEVVLRFKATFRVNDPFTDITLSFTDKTPHLTWQD